MKKVLSTLLAATLLLTTVTGLKSLSVSAEGAADTANNNELIANGDFESADTVVLADDFEGYNSGNITGTTWEDTIKIQQVPTIENATNKTLRIQQGATHKVTMRPNTEYTLSFKIIGDPNVAEADGKAIYQFLVIIAGDAHADGKLSWSSVMAANSAGGLVCIDEWTSKNGDNWLEYSKTFTTPANLGESNERYLTAITSWRGLLIDNLKLTAKYTNTVKGFTAVEDPDNAENHCLKLAQWNAPKVSNLAVESNTFYKFSYKYKRIDEADKESNLYCIIYHSGNSAADNRVAIFDTKGEVNTGYGATAFNSGAKLSTAADWQESSYIFKTGEVDSIKTWTLQMTVTGSQMYADDFSLTKLVSDSEVSADFGFIGTAIKATPESENNQQLRFKAEVNKEALAAKHYDGFTVTEYGFLAFRKDYLKDQDGELTLNVTAKDDSTKATLQKPAYVADVNGNSTTDIVFSEDDTAKQFYARLTGFKVTNYDKTYLVRTYAKLKNADGVELTVYVSDTTGLGVYDLAYAAFTATNSDGSYAESFETRTVLYNLLQGSSYKDSITAPQA